jgi:ubiquinone/menaquinone biosynthesis C-methylase UbiE
MNQSPNQTQNSYDAVAANYAEQFRDEMRKKPFDRKMLDWLIEKNANLGTICELGCGPGMITGYLSEQGATVCGIDLSAKMIEEARKQFPQIRFEQGDMLDLKNVEDNSFGGIAAFYSIIHVSPERVGDALREMRRVLIPGGVLLLTFHIGSETRHLDEWFEKKVNLDFHFFEREEMKTLLTEAGFSLEETIERDPYAEVEVQTRRAYIFARK